MSAASNYAENLALTWLLTASSATRPSAWYLALYTNDPGEANSGTEVSGTNYARQNLNVNGSSGAFTVSGNTASNTQTVTFPAAGSGGWGTISHVAIFDASTSGNLLFKGAVTTSKQIDQGDTFQVSSSALTISLD